MPYAPSLYVVGTFPVNNASEVSTDAAIRIEFNAGLNRNFIASSIVVRCLESDRVDDKLLNDPAFISKTTMVAGDITYADKELTFQPTENLKPNMVYHVTVVSDEASRRGVRSIVDSFLPTGFSFTFTTTSEVALSQVNLQLPTQEAVVSDIPRFVWQDVADATFYELEISRTNTFASPIWPIEPTPLAEAAFTPDPEIFKDNGIYYWRVRACREGYEPGPYSKVSQFNLDRDEVAPVVPEDSYSDSNIDYSYPELIENFPESNFSNVATNLRSVFAKVSGDIDIAKLHRDSFCLYGESLEEEALSHGEVDCHMTLAKTDDGETIIVLTPKTE